MKAKLLLKNDVPGLGITGDVVEVSQGYARNFLLPKGQALEINPSTLQQIEAAKKRRAARELEHKRELEALAERINGVTLTVAARVAESGTLYGSVSPAQIVSALAAAGIHIDEHMIHLDEHIKALGEHTVPIHLRPEVDAECRVVVVPDETAPPVPEEEAASEEAPSEDEE